MKYASIIIGIVVLLILVGVAVGIARRSGPVAYTGSPYQASLTGTTAAPCPAAYQVANTYVSPCTGTTAAIAPIQTVQTAPIVALPATAVLPIATNIPVVAVAAAPRYQYAQYQYPAYPAAYTTAAVNTCGCAAAAPIYTSAAVNYANPAAVWYTSPSGPYTYSMPYTYSDATYSQNTTVYPGTSQTYSYTLPNTSSYSYQYQTSGGTGWYQ